MDNENCVKSMKRIHVILTEIAERGDLNFTFRAICTLVNGFLESLVTVVKLLVTVVI